MPIGIKIEHLFTSTSMEALTSMATNVSLKGEVLIVNFKGKRAKMNEILDPISNLYEGVLKNREGHNFPANYIPTGHTLLAKYKKQCRYIIGIYNTRSLSHELRHAKYFLDQEYRRQIENEWKRLPFKIRNHISQFLKKLGYADRVLIDEYQAYRYTEAPNFFGIKLPLTRK